MTKQQREVSRKLFAVGCTSRYDEDTKRLCILCGGENLCSLSESGIYSYPADRSLSDEDEDEQEEIRYRVEKLIDSTKDAVQSAWIYDDEGQEMEL